MNTSTQENIISNQQLYLHATTNSSLYWITSLDKENKTPLHICCILQRLDILESLLHIPTMNDTIHDIHGKVPMDYCTDSIMISIMNSYRKEYCIQLQKEIKHVIVTKQCDLDLYFRGKERALGYIQLGWLDINGIVETETNRYPVVY
jgi:ankyrin repeat protein